MPFTNGRDFSNVSKLRCTIKPDIRYTLYCEDDVIYNYLVIAVLEVMYWRLSTDHHSPAFPLVMPARQSHQIILSIEEAIVLLDIASLPTI